MQMINSPKKITQEEAARYLKVKEPALQVYLKAHFLAEKSGMIAVNRLIKEIEKESLNKK